MKIHHTFTVCIACIACIVCIPLIVPAQVNDDFSDGDFTNNPEWGGDATQFEINSSGQLHLNSTGSDTSILFTRNSRIKDTEWRFWMKLSFNTSSGNNARVYLAADTSCFTCSLNACYIQAGGSDDSVFIIKQTGPVTEKLFRFKKFKTSHSTNVLRFRITCDVSGSWEAMIDTTGGHNYISEGTFFSPPDMTARWFGVMCKYTSSNAAKYYFDDFYAGPVVHDTITPTIISAEAAAPDVVKIRFSEPVQKIPAEDPGNYRHQPDGTLPDSVAVDISSPDMVSLFLQEPMADGSSGSFEIRNIPDLSGNRMQDTVIQVSYYPAKAHDILISEIMADPDPPVGLPDGEFVELYNRSEFPINLKDWTFRYGSSSKSFPPMVIPSKGHALIVKDPAFLNYAACAVLFTSSSSLSNEGTTLALSDARHHIIHTVDYKAEWYQGSFKGEGGWSLEMKDISNPCGCADNWGPSKDVAGGTPGRINSVSGKNPDEKAPIVSRAFISDSSVVNVRFSEEMDSTTMLNLMSWRISPFDGHPDGVAYPVRVVPTAPDFTSCELYSDEAFQKGTIYNLRVAGPLTDCAGNECDTSLPVRFAIPDSLAFGDLVINEVLSNPVSGGSRFIELYNRSEKTVDLQSAVISNQDSISGSVPDAKPLAESGFLLFPGDYIAFATNPTDICNRYSPPFPGNIVSMNGFPVLGDDTGTIIIARKDNLAIIDRMKYNTDMHWPLLATTEGVSLERTSPDQPSVDLSNWHSAAETAGFATPGYLNSHRIFPGEPDHDITVQPAIFSPDNDGRDDLLFISVHEKEPDVAVSIVVYDARGRFVQQIANNVLQGSEGVFIWDGITANRSKAPIGIYVMLIELIRMDGTVVKVKRTAILGGML